MGGKGSGRKDNDKDAKTLGKVRDAVQKEDGKAIEESKRKAKQAFTDKKKGGKGK